MPTEWTCTEVGSSTECIATATSTPFVQDAGNVSFGLSIIIGILAFAMALYIHNLFMPKKRV